MKWLQYVACPKSTTVHNTLLAFLVSPCKDFYTKGASLHPTPTKCMLDYTVSSATESRNHTFAPILLPAFDSILTASRLSRKFSTTISHQPVWTTNHSWRSHTAKGQVPGSCDNGRAIQLQLAQDAARLCYHCCLVSQRARK